MDNKFIRKIFTYLVFILPLFLLLGPNAFALDLVISGNGEGSSSEVVTSVETTTEIVQTNSADVGNDVDVETNTGGNEANSNNSDKVNIDTGDASSEVVIENSVNSSVIEYDGCCEEQATVEISNNASNSNNTIGLNVEVSDSVSVSQNAQVTNIVYGVTNTGDNTASGNSGSVSIITGDAKATGAIINGPINTTYIDYASGGIGNIAVLIKGNGSGSSNNIFANIQRGSEINKMEYVNIFNDVVWAVNTGRNSANRNNGPVFISTGNAFLDFLISNEWINTNYVEYDGCCDGSGEPTPTPTPDPSVTPTPDPGTSPTPTPTPDPGDPGNGGNGGDGGSSTDSGSSDGGDGGSVAAAAILGLSDTSATGPSALIFWAGLIMIALGAQLLLPSVLPTE